MSTPPNVETRGPAILGTAIALPIFAAVFVGARVYTRTRIISFFGIDDWCSIATLVVSIAYSVCLGIWSQHGGGMHMKDMTKDIEVEYYKWLMIASEFYALALLGYKTAILLLYVRLFSINKKFKIACYAVMTFNACYLLSNIFLQIFSCMPIEKFYQKDLPGSCVSLTAPDIAWGAMSMASDFAIALLPIPVVWRLKLSYRDKILVSLVFLSGLIAFVMALVRWILATVDLTAEDRTWLAGLTFLFSIVEVNTGIICGCTATLKPLFRFARDASTRRKSTSGANEKKHRWYHSSSSEEEARHDPLRAPPGTLDQSTNKTLDTTKSQDSSNTDIGLPLSSTTTARPSLADAMPTESHFSNDLLNLPIEGAREEPPPTPRTRTAMHELGPSQRQQRHELASQRQVPELATQRQVPELPTQRQIPELVAQRQTHELPTWRSQSPALQSNIHELGTRQQSALPPPRTSHELDSNKNNPSPMI